MAKRSRRFSDSSPSSTLTDPCDAYLNELGSNCCGQVRSAIVAGALGGPAIHSILSSSLISMLSVLRMTLTQNYPPSTTTPPHAPPDAALQATSISLLSPARIIAAMPHLMALARIPLPTGMENVVRNPQMFPPIPPPTYPRIGPLHSSSHRNTFVASNQARQYLTTGGVGITASANDSCIYYYCRLRLRIRLDMGDSRGLLVQQFFVVFIFYVPKPHLLFERCSFS